VGRITVVVGVFFFVFSSRRRHTRLVSDWSSDVCSSDLKVHVSIHAPGNAAEVARVIRQVDALQGAGIASGINLLVRASQLAEAEIGRASCRERVEMSVGAGSLKRKRREGRREKYQDS